MFDYLSTLERKNPLGAIEAYRRAFAPDDGAVLVVKSVNGRHRPERHAEVTAAVEGRRDIVSIDRTISGAERDALIGACDCYLSLHRSEGHGMPLAEAMALGKPVVATAYGGNIEFMNEANSYLVALGIDASRCGSRALSSRRQLGRAGHPARSQIATRDSQRSTGRSSSRAAGTTGCSGFACTSGGWSVDARQAAGVAFHASR